VVGSTLGIGDRYDPRVGVATDAVPGTLYVDDWVKDMLTKPRRNNVQQPISRLRIHDLRHTHAAWLLSDGVPVFVVQRRLGHSSSATTENVYGLPLLVMELS
jgi:integrase